jgi:hypothetical protein
VRFSARPVIAQPPQPRLTSIRQSEDPCTDLLGQPTLIAPLEPLATHHITPPHPIGMDSCAS